MSKLYNEKRSAITSKSQKIKILDKDYNLKFLQGSRNYFEVIGNNIYIHLKNESKRKDMITKAFVAIADAYLKKRVKY